jgi:uncharacterized membrane protein
MSNGRPEFKVPVGDEGSGKEVTPLQRVGYKLALFVLGYIFVASIAIFIVSFYMDRLPPVPMPPTSSGSDTEHYKALVAAYKDSADVYQQLAKARVDRAIQLFQLVVASTILPAFTAILGYIFGSRKFGE